MKNNPRADLANDALLMAIWRRKPKDRVLIHSDQDIQYTYGDWKKFAKEYIDISMSRRGSCHDNAVAESFFSLQKLSGLSARFTKRGKILALRYLITSSFTTTRTASMATMTAYRQRPSKNNIMSSCQLCRKLGACHNQDIW